MNEHGWLADTAKQKNVVLAQTQEWRPPYKDEVVSSEKINEFGLVKNRFLGLTVIPGKLIQKIEVMAEQGLPMNLGHWNAG
jgi:hypothetical protein